MQTHSQRRIKSLKPPNPSEHAEQAHLVTWWGYECKRLGVPERLLFAIPNGGERHPAVAAKLKAEGVRPGIPDLFLSVGRGGYHGLYVEMKSLTTYPTANQKDAHTLLRRAGYRVEVCQGADAAKQTITAYLEAA